MADGTPDFADLLAAFDEAPTVTLHQISSGHGSNLQLGGGAQLSLNQPYITGQSHAQFVQMNQGAPQSQLGQMAGLNQSAGLQRQAFGPADVPQQPAPVEDSFGGGGSLGSMFLSSVESMLSDETTSFMLPISQASAPPKTTQRKPRQQRPKQTNAPLNRSVQNVNVQPFANITPTAAPAQGNIALQNTSMGANTLGMKVPVTSPPFVLSTEIQQGSVTLPTAGQQKSHPGPFVHPTQGTRQQPQAVNPPRPLSAASSTSEHMSRPGSVPQPSPSCGSNHSGDPATPQSYSAGTPQSYNAGTPQSYNAGTPQPYKPATPQSNLPSSGQPRQRTAGYGDVHQQPQVLPGMNTGAPESFVSNQQANLTLQVTSPPMHALNTSNESLNDLPTPLKEALIPQSSSSFEARPIDDGQLWNTGPAVMAPSALFMSTAQSKVAATPSFAPTDPQLNFGYSDMYGMPLQHAFITHRQESNVRSESLTSKQNELLDQMSSFGKTKKPAAQNLGLDSGIVDSTVRKYLDLGQSGAPLTKQSETSATMNLMNKANDAGSAVVKELLGSQYEAISPVSDYAMSPVHKSNLHDALPESLFSPPKFSSHSDLPLPHDPAPTHPDPMTDPVLMYLKHDDDKISKNNNNSSVSVSNSSSSSSSFFTQNISPTLSMPQTSWVPQSSSAPFSSVSSTTSNAPLFSSDPASANNLMQTVHWSSSLPVTSNVSLRPTSVTQSISSLQAVTKVPHDGAKSVHTSPIKQKTQTTPPTSRNSDKPFGVSCRKASTDKPKSGSSKTKKTPSLDSNFGFNSDDEGEPTICLSKASPKAKKPSKAPQPGLLSPTSYPSNLSDQMEHLKRLSEQREMLLKLQRYQEQHGASSQAANAALTLHMNAQAAPTRTTHNSESFRRTSTEKDSMVLPTQTVPLPTLPSNKHSVKTPVSVSAKKTTLGMPAPLSLAQPTVSPRFGGMSKVQMGAQSMPLSLPSISHSTVQTPSVSSVQNASFPNILGFLNLPTTDHGTSFQSSLPFPSSYSTYSTTGLPLAPKSTQSGQSIATNLDVRSLVETPSTRSSSLPLVSSYPAGTPLNQPLTTAQSYPTGSISHSASLPSTKSVGSNLNVSSSSATTAAPSLGRPQPFESQFNLDWLHREPEVLSGKYRTPESASEATNTPRSISHPLTTETPSILPTISSATVAPKYPAHNLPEDNIMPLKQSIHTVHHLDIPRSQTALSVPASSVATSAKETTPVLHETKHLNYRKHRILEHYPTENYKSRVNSQNTPVTQVNTPAHSVLDKKQRRYSKERNDAKPKHRVQHQVTDTPKLPTATTVSSQPNVKATQLSGAATSVAPSTDTQHTKATKMSESGTAKEGKKDKPTDDQAGSMLMLFNSLLQEASESAAGSLKTTLSPQPAKTGKAEEIKVSSPPTSKPPVVETPKVVVSVPNSKVTTTSTAQATSSQTLPPKKPAKKNRPAATVPFKRRPYPAFDDTLATATATIPSRPVTASIKVSDSAPAVTSSASLITVPQAPPKSVPSSVSTGTLKKTLVIKSAAITKPSVTHSQSPPVTQSSHVPVKIPTPQITPEKSPSSSIGVPKLKITLFRSSKGEVIHQSSMLGSGKDSDNVDSEGSTHRKRHKRKKKKKKKHKISSSDNESVASHASKSSTAEQTIKLALEAKMNEKITKELEKKAQNIFKSVEASNVIATTSTVVDPAVKDQEENAKPPQKRKRTKQNTVDIPEKKKPAKRVRVTKANAKKKQDAKDDGPIARYQPKSALQASSSATGGSASTKTSVSLPSTYHRAPGKLPLYLNSSEAKSATVPTIQLVARNTKLLGNVVEPKTTTPAKVVSVKITNSLPANKSFPTQFVPNSGVQYIIPSTRAQQRVILPNISLSTPVTVPVSIVSPLFARSFTGGFVPVSMGTLTTTSPSTNTKPQLFSVPISLSESLPNPVKIVKQKQPDGTKSAVVTAKLPASSAVSKIVTNRCTNTSVTTQNSTITVTGTLTTPRVTTKVISAAASKQMTSNTFQSTFLKLISSQNPVPTYVPASPPPHLALDLSGRKQFQCLECKDTFMFEDSLDNHYERRCILIKVRCMQCDHDLVFLNKCKLLLHARQHSDKGGNGMQFNNAHIAPLPLSMCKPRSKESFLNKCAGSVAERRKSSVLSSEDEVSGVSAGIPASFPTVLACTDCNFSGSTPEALEEHFQRVSPPVSPDKSTGVKPAPNFTCELCSVSVPNQCSFMAHMRMHKRATPHTCPECGQTFDNDGLQEYAYSESRREIDFNLHLSVQCFHLSRMSAYKCKLCNSIFKNSELLRRHLEDRHLQMFYKCRDCPMAFKTQENIASHQRSAHGVVAITKTIHKCPLCDTVFTDNSRTQQLFLLQKHFDGHMSHPSINITAYKCLFCNNIYERKHLLRDHLKSVHDVAASGDSGSGGEIPKELSEKRIVVSMERKEGSGTARKRPLIKSTLKEPLHKMPRIISPDRSSISSTSNLLIASGILANRDGSNKKGVSGGKSSDAPMVKNTIQPLKLRLKALSAHNSNTTAKSSSLLEDDTDISANVGAIVKDGRKVYPCGQCSKELPSASARLNHIRLKHKGIRTMYCCPHCPRGKIQFAKKISLKKHLKKIHELDDIKKQDVLIEYVKLPIGQKFEPASFNPGTGNSDSQQAPRAYGGTSGLPENKVRKKFTGISRRTNLRRPLRQVRRDIGNGSPYVENSDSEVEQIMSNHSMEDSVTERSDSEEPNFSLLKLPDFYNCAKCDYESKDRLEFQAHIIEHRDDAECEGMLSTMQQCTECGLCFASVASHAKHLFIKHKIKRKRLLEKYDERIKSERAANGSLPVPLLGDATSNGQNGLCTNKKKHKCSVCFKRFEDDTKLRTHMRTHGLAFVKSKHSS